MSIWAGRNEDFDAVPCNDACPAGALELDVMILVLLQLRRQSTPPSSDYRPPRHATKRIFHASSACL